MQLKFSHPLAFRTTGSGFKSSASALLSAVTVVGVFSTVVFNSSAANSKINESFQWFSKTLNNSYLFDGVKNIASKFKDWGQTIVTSKDDFSEWLSKYFGPDGFKSGVVNLYEKLRDWILLVYTWFKDKFLEFIGNIPKMVEDWRKLRLSLFKWGTFLGGGGGGALWAMFGSFDNLGKLAELMGNSAVREAAEMFADLVDKNPDAFKDMGQDAMQEILERIAEEPENAKEIMKELKKEQEEMAEKSKEEVEPQLEQERIKEAFNQSKGSPRSEEQVLSNLVGKTLEGLSGLKSSYSGEFNSGAVEAKAKEEIEKYMKEIETKKDEKTKLGKVYNEFLKTLDSDKETFKEELKKLAVKAFWKAKVGATGDSRELNSLRETFAEVMENDLTQLIKDGEDTSDAVDLKKLLQINGKK